MPRSLTANERAVLAHVVVDPDAWWSHACATPGVDAEQALADKIQRWQGAYDAALVAEGVAYKNRAQRDAEEATIE